MLIETELNLKLYMIPKILRSYLETKVLWVQNIIIKSTSKVLAKKKNKKRHQRFISKSIIGQQWIDAQDFWKWLLLGKIF
jgi:hypothetical protein